MQFRGTCVLVFHLSVVAQSLNLRRHAHVDYQARSPATDSRSSAYKVQIGHAAQRFDLDLKDLSLHIQSTGDSVGASYHSSVHGTIDGGVPDNMDFYIASASVNRQGMWSVDGDEVACISCDLDLFHQWVRQSASEPREGLSPQARKPMNSNKTAWKHPNSPRYVQWESDNTASIRNLIPSGNGTSASLLSISVREPGLAISHFRMDSSQVQANSLWLQKLWDSRRLVIGLKRNPLFSKMDFATSLAAIAKDAPMMSGPECVEQGIPYCDSLFRGDRSDSGEQLRQMLHTTFGAAFLRERRFASNMTAADQRRNVQSLLSALKDNYVFYRRECLTHEAGDDKCSVGGSSKLMGQIRCKPGEDKPSDDCVFSELRVCEACGEGGSRFFEYARFHGPLALFMTRANRHGVMGQCEEFSRAGHALISGLGYKTRYVLGFTDHVWLEVWLNNTWVHADPSEGTLDQPLMYEKGWGQSLTMIFAFTSEHIEHVTRSYTTDYEATIERRGISEDGLRVALDEANAMLPAMYSKKWGRDGSNSRSLEKVALWQHFEGVV